MRRKALMILLGVGAVAGFGSGFARLAHRGDWHFGHGPRGHRADLERRVADACTESALRVYREQASKAGPVP